MKHKIICGDAVEELKKLPENSVDTCVTDPPYELNFMNKGWDRSGIAFHTEMWQELYRVLKPGAHILVAGIARTHHRMWVALEDVGFEIRDGIYHIFGSGFPKSTDISKQIDKFSLRIEMFTAFAEHFKEQREQKGITHKEIAKHFLSKTGGITGCVWNWENGMNVPTMEQWEILQPLLGMSNKCSSLIERAEAEREIIGKDGRIAEKSIFGTGIQKEWDITAPSTEEAIKWNGWGTALKPSIEIWCLARKPISERNIAANVLKWSCGGINVDGCRIIIDKNDVNIRKGITANVGSNTFKNQKGGIGVIDYKDGNMNKQGRFPANLILECCCGKDELMMGNDPTHPGQYRNIRTPKRIFESEIGINEKNKNEVTCEKGNKCLIHTNPNCVCRMLDEQGIERGVHSAGSKLDEGEWERSHIHVIMPSFSGKGMRFGDVCGPSRFFYQAKASQNERYFYCTICKQVYHMKERDKHIHNAFGNEKYKYLEFHPTQKPEDLIGYLMRLITPPNGTTIDPFLGSGTAIIAAEREGFNCVGIDSSPIYCEIAFKRSNGELIQQKISGNQSTIEKTGF